MENFKNLEEFAAAYEQFYQSHPEAPVAENVECLNLVMKRVNAEQILAGTKKLEFREYKPFYIKRLIDSDVTDYIREHADDDDVLTFCSDIRHVNKIHFHDYNNSWYLDVECELVNIFSITKQYIEQLQKQYGCHDFDNDLRRMDAMGIPQDERPWLFYLVCGKVLGTNLEVKAENEEFVEYCGGKTFEQLKPSKNVNKDNNLDIITFRVNKDEYNDIISGSQIVFEKLITPGKEGLYCLLNEDGSMKEINGIVQIRKYDAIQFVNKIGTYTCKFEKADVVFSEVGESDPITSFNTKIVDDECFDFESASIVYYLGDEIKP